MDQKYGSYSKLSKELKIAWQFKHAKRFLSYWSNNILTVWSIIENRLAC